MIFHNTTNAKPYQKFTNPALLVRCVVQKISKYEYSHAGSDGNKKWPTKGVSEITLFIGNNLYR